MKLLNFRVSTDISEKLKLLKNYFKSTLNTSDLIRNLLDKSIKNEVKQLEKFAPDLVVMAQKQCSR